MGNIVRIIIPDECDRDGKPSGWKRITDRIANMFGGCTTWRAQGAWAGASGQIDHEHVVVCECSISAWTPQVREWWCRLAASIAETWNQDSVYLSLRRETALLVSRDDEVGFNTIEIGDQENEQRWSNKDFQVEKQDQRLQAYGNELHGSPVEPRTM